jgi:hypothetical protein
VFIVGYWWLYYINSLLSFFPLSPLSLLLHLWLSYINSLLSFLPPSSSLSLPFLSLLLAGSISASTRVRHTKQPTHFEGHRRQPPPAPWVAPFPHNTVTGSVR